MKATIALVILIDIAIFLGIYQLGKYHQRQIIIEEIRSNRSRVTIKIPSLGVDIHAPSGRIMTVGIVD